MSERGSYVTEFIYCSKCLAAAESVLCGTPHKYLTGSRLPALAPDTFWPIIAGKIGGIYAGHELSEFEYEIQPKLEAVICHPLRVAVLPEDGMDTFFVVEPRERD